MLSVQTDRAWLVALADMSLLLFILTAAALRPDTGEGLAEREYADPAFGAAAEIFVDGPTGPDFADWLGAAERGDGQHLTITASYAVLAERDAMQRRSEELAAAAIAAGYAPRVVVQQAGSAQIVAVFAHDATPGLAQQLL